MTILKKGVSIDEVIHCFESENRGSLSFSYTARLLREAGANSGDDWCLVRLSQADILNISLPHHRHPPDVTVIPEPGMEVAAAADCVIEITRRIGPCWENIQSHKNRDFSKTHLFLKFENGVLSHLDGLHRLLAWAIFDKDQELDAYVSAFRADSPAENP